MSQNKPYLPAFDRKLFLLASTLLCFCFALAQDDCSTAQSITLAGGGFGAGLVTSPVISITAATVQPGETFSPANTAAGQTKKTIWYKFNLPTTRSVTIRLAENATSIAAGEVGFALYKSASCIPGSVDLSSQLFPVTDFGTSTSSCLQAGDYLVQVAARSSAIGSVYIDVQTGPPASSPFDSMNQAYDFGTLATGVKSVNYRVECQSLDAASEICSSLSNSTEYTKSTWHVFTTPNYFDYVSLVIANQSPPPGRTYGFNIYKGDVRSSPGTLVSGCHSMSSNSYQSAQHTFTCSDLEPNTTYSIQVFYHQSFTDNVDLSLVTAGIVPTALPQPVLSSLIGNNSMRVTPTTSGVSFNPQDYFGCNSRHSITACGPSLPSAGINFKDRNFNLSSFFSVDLTSAALVNLSATPSCGPPLLIRVFRQALTNNCSDLDPVNIVGEGIGSAALPYCLPAGKYVVQVSGTDSVADNSFIYGTSSTSAPCLLSNLGSFFSLNLAATTPVPRMERIDSTLCPGQAYTLSNGIKVSANDTYLDTLRTVNGCDSLVRVLNLNFKQITVQPFFAYLCAGQSYTLPSGAIVNTPGDYSDTLKYTSSCDSVIRVVHLQRLSPKTLAIDSYICEGDSLRLPWGPVVKTGGSYNDTIRNVAGCDSMIILEGVYVRARPAVTVSKSNDISCALGSARLTATGGTTYSWSPPTGLDRTDVFDPVASPPATTTYHVMARSPGGCTTEDSIQLLVSMVSSNNSFLVPNSFTPNGDGVNDCFGLRHWGAVTDLHFAIYDRWGKRVFYTSDVGQCWDGTLGGTPLPPATYIYSISAKSVCGDVVRKGTVTLVR